MRPVADLHCDTALELQAGADLAAGNPPGHVDIPRWRAGGVGLQLCACFVSSAAPAGRAFTEVQSLLDAVDRAAAEHHQDLALCETAAEVRDAQGRGLVALVKAVENGVVLGNDLSRLEALRRRGVRYLTLTHSAHLPWAASSGEPGGDGVGLSPFGREVVAEMNRLGILVDLSHVHESTFWDAVRLSRRPVIASHSCCRALCDTPRNLTDDQLRAIGACGGVVGVNFFPGFLDPAYLAVLTETTGDLFAAYDRIEADLFDQPERKASAHREMGVELRRRVAGVAVGLDRLAEHVEHIVAIAGEDAVAFGSDFDGLPDLPRGVAGADAFPAVLATLERRGMPGTTLHKLAWGNALRVLDAA